MKHPVRDRLLMLFYALASLGAAAALFAVVLGRITPDMISGAAAQVYALPGRTLKIALIACAVILVLFGLALIGAMFPPKRKRSSNFAIQHNENGMVRISLKTIDALVQKCLGQHSELKVVTSSLFSDEETVRVDVHIALLTDISMPLAISALQKQITRYVEACSGVNVKEVRVFVDGALPGGEKAQLSKYVLPANVLGGEPEASSEEEAPAVEETPVIEEAPAVEETPAVEEASAVEETPAAEEAPTVEEAPAVEEAPVIEETPAVEEAAVVEEAPAAEEAPTVEETPAVEEAPVAEEAPASAEEPAPAKKKLFGLFGK